MAGTKYDSEKPRMDLIPCAALLGIAEVLTFGAKKYGDNNWREGIEHHRLYAAAMRHMNAYWSGQTLDPESGINHLKHALCNLSMMVETPDKDDRYKVNDENNSIRSGDRRPSGHADEDSLHSMEGSRGGEDPPHRRTQMDWELLGGVEYSR